MAEPEPIRPMSEPAAKEVIEPVKPRPWKGQVSIGGPRTRPQMSPPAGSNGWNAGDIDFKDDGKIFIRNPYLADAIEKHLMKHAKGEEPYVRIVRDEGWSGRETNVIC